MQEQHKQAIRLLDKIRSYSDDNNAQAIVQLKQQAQKLIDDFERQVNARSLEDQAKRVQQIAARLQETEMDHRHSDDIQDICQDIRMALRKL